GRIFSRSTKRGLSAVVPVRKRRGSRARSSQCAKLTVWSPHWGFSHQKVRFSFCSTRLRSRIGASHSLEDYSMPTRSQFIMNFLQLLLSRDFMTHGKKRHLEMDRQVATWSSPFKIMIAFGSR